VLSIDFYKPFFYSTFTSISFPHPWEATHRKTNAIFSYTMKLSFIFVSVMANLVSAAPTADTNVIAGANVPAAIVNVPEADVNIANADANVPNADSTVNPQGDIGADPAGDQRNRFCDNCRAAFQVCRKVSSR
jgi:hypothetical protein